MAGDVVDVNGGAAVSGVVGRGLRERRYAIWASVQLCKGCGVAVEIIEWSFASLQGYNTRIAVGGGGGGRRR